MTRRPSLFALLVGASASGKSRLVAAVQRIAQDNGTLHGLRVVPRYTTRIPRETESFPEENRHLAQVEFDDLRSAAAVDVAWERPIGQSRNAYAFRLQEPIAESGRLWILPGNSYLDWRAHPLLVQLREQGRLLLLRVFASLETRLMRLTQRRPPLSTEELDARMADIPPSELPPVDFVICNDPPFEQSSAWQFLEILNMFVFRPEQFAGEFAMDALPTTEDEPNVGRYLGELVDRFG